MPESLVLSLKETARLLRISNSLAYDLARRGVLPGQLPKLGEKRVLVSRARLEAWIAGQEKT
jgi:excisionase family DNA binding protein